MGTSTESGAPLAVVLIADGAMLDRIVSALPTEAVPRPAGGHGATFDDAPDVVIVHFERSDVDGVLDVAAAHRGAPVVGCSPPLGPRALRRAVDGGVDGLVWEDDIELRLSATIRAVALGQIAVPREVWRRTERPELTNREKQALSLVIMGLSNGEIATKLYVSESTVKSHLSSAFRKLGVSSRAEAARLIADPRGSLGTGILAITPTSSSGRASEGSR